MPRPNNSKGRSQKKSVKPTTYDVAERAQVSQMTVSRVLRGETNVSAEVVEKVHAAANAIGYVRNQLAGSFAGQSSNLVGVIIPALSNSVFTEVLAGLENSLRNSRYQIAISVNRYDPTVEFELVRDMIAWRPAGIVLTGIDHEGRTRELIQQNGIRCVEIIDIDGEPISQSIGLSHYKAGEIMANYLIDGGYKRFGYVGCTLQKDQRALKRKKAFETTLANKGYRIERSALSDQTSSMLLGRQLTESILSDNDKPIALYYSNDDLAAGGLMHCISNNINIPEDVAIASFNGLEFLAAMPKSITTFKTPRFKIGQLAGACLLDQITERVTELKGDLITGETT